MCNRVTSQPTVSTKTAHVSRRAFLQRATAAAAFTIVPRHVLGGYGYVAPSEKITLAVIGTGGQGIYNIEALLPLPEIQITAVCDVNREGPGYLSWYWRGGKDRRVAGREPAKRLVEEHYGKGTESGTFRGCASYADFRELLEKEDVDAALVATPDHTHAVITMAALRRRKHVFCEKPLTWSVYEARQIAEAARAANVATQLGNQGQASEEARLTCEIIWSGAIGPVHEVQVGVGPRFWQYPTSDGRPSDMPPVPDGLDWDLWLGPAPERTYHPAYCPWVWRNWWDFGTGLLGDLWCHTLSTAFKALKLAHPTSVEACSTKNDWEVYPAGVIARFEFPARGDMPPLKLTWYDGGLAPPRPKDLERGRQPSGVLYLGESGTLMGHRLIPESKMQSFGRPATTLPRSPGHFQEWIQACKGGPPAGSNFVDHAGLLTEACLLGNVALRAGRKLDWDGPNLKITNDEAANQHLHREYRTGWSL